MRKTVFGLYTVLLLMATPAVANNLSKESLQQDAALIRHTYESQLYTLPAFQMGHYGLRMYRQTQDPKYTSAIWADLARVASNLNELAAEVHTREQIKLYSQGRIDNYSNANKTRRKLRYKATKDMPEYLFLGVDLLGSMARANEYGLKHKEDAKLREIIRRYNFEVFATDSLMIEAWAAQLANQVYWLRQLGEQDVVAAFITAFRKTYPDSKDYKLSNQQFENKLYGMTHIILGASEFYQRYVNEKEYQWIYDYYRKNIDAILEHAKEDVVAEVGISFLLAGLENDPVVNKTRARIQQAISPSHGMIPSVKGNLELTSGEHRNVLAVMLLDWRAPKAIPKYQNQAKVFSKLPYGLVAK